MVALEVFLAGICLNLTCPDEPMKDQASAKRLRYDALAEELKGQHLYVTTVKNDMLSDINKTGHGVGVAFDLLNILKKKFGFNYTIIPPIANEYGTPEKGIVGMLVKGEVNISAAFMPVITQYRHVIHYSPSLDTGEWMVLMKRPAESATGTGLLAPFDGIVWILIAISLFAVGPIIYFIVYLYAKYCTDDQTQIFSLGACFWFVYGALLKQGSTLNPLSDSARVMFATWWIFITVLTAFYTANLTAFLTLSDFTLPIKSPGDIGAGQRKWVTNKGNAIEDAINLATAQIENPEEFMELSKTLGRESYYVNTSDYQILKSYVSDRSMMFIREKPIIEYDMYDDYKKKVANKIKEADRCTYVIADFSVMSFARAFAYNINFKYYELFNYAIQYLVESGVIGFKLYKGLPTAKLCPIQLQSTDRRLKNSDLKLTYIIVGIGFCVSLTIFIIESVRNYYNKTEKKDSSISRHDYVKHGYYPKPGQNIVTFNSKFTPPPPYNALFNQSNAGGKKKFINGREYWVFDDERRMGTKLVPTRAPSAMLFQYTN